MNTNPIKRDARHARRRRVLPENAECACGETDPRCLVQTGDRVTCYACEASAAGRSGTERHHFAGRHNLTTTMPVPNNEHRILSDQQQDWPTPTLRNPSGSPLLRASGAIRGWMDLLVLILERIISWIPGFLEALDAWLCERLGQAWHVDFLASSPGVVPGQGRGHPG